MILKNFSIKGSFSELLFENKLCDLHNCYEWLDTKRNEHLKTLELLFVQRQDDYVDPTTPAAFIIRFNNVISVEEQDHDPDYPKEYLNQDGNTIDLFGFSDFDIPIDGVSPKTSSKEGLDCLSLITVTGKALRIQADSAEIEVKE